MSRTDRNILGHMEHGAAVAVIDALRTVTGWSEGARRLPGHPAEDVVGRPAAGLLAQLTQRWGIRQTGRGKTIWAERALPCT